MFSTCQVYPVHGCRRRKLPCTGISSKGVRKLREGASVHKLLRQQGQGLKTLTNMTKEATSEWVQEKTSQGSIADSKHPQLFFSKDKEQWQKHVNGKRKGEIAYKQLTINLQQSNSLNITMRSSAKNSISNFLRRSDLIKNFRVEKL